MFYGNTPSKTGFIGWVSLNLAIEERERDV